MRPWKIKKNPSNEELIQYFIRGTDYGNKVSIYAKDKNFIVFRINGHKYWNGRFSPQAYMPLRHVLIRRGDFCIGNDTREWSGRLTIKIANEISKALRQSEKDNAVYKGEFND